MCAQRLLRQGSPSDDKNATRMSLVFFLPTHCKLCVRLLSWFRDCFLTHVDFGGDTDCEGAISSHSNLCTTRRFCDRTPSRRVHEKTLLWQEVGFTHCGNNNPDSLEGTGQHFFAAAFGVVVSSM